MIRLRGPLSDGDYARLCGVASRLATSYPPDWLERCGPQLYAVATLLCFLLGYWIAVVWSAWWAYLVPTAGPLLVSAVPMALFGREPGCPRWAHPKAVVDARDVALVDMIVDAMDAGLRRQLAPYCPPRDGAKFFRVWQALHDAGCEESR